MGYGYGNGRGGQAGGGESKFFASAPRILYGIMKELQRANALKALELKWQIDEDSPVTAEDVDKVMSTDPGRSYGRDDRDDAGRTQWQEQE